MCGIVAYLGPREAYPILIKGLHRLEYRGYDSAGVALLNGGLSVFKTKGRVSDLENFARNENLHATIGIAHTRWATHGEPIASMPIPIILKAKNWPSFTMGLLKIMQYLKKL